MPKGLSGVIALGTAALSSCHVVRELLCVFILGGSDPSFENPWSRKP